MRKIFGHPDEPQPRWTWRTKLIRLFIKGFRKDFYTTLVFGLESDGCVLVGIATPDREIITSCHVASHSFDNLIAHMENVQAHKKLVDP